MTKLIGCMIALAGCMIPALAQNIEIALVKGSPFSAQASTETTQVLVDGNRIVGESTASIARDSEGRTRRQQNTIVFVQDPVTSLTAVIDQKTKSVRSMPGPKATAGKRTQPEGIETASLGTRLMEGVQVKGTRLTRTIAPGTEGNENPIEVVIEAWYSEELQTAVMTKTTDPRLGETIYKLTEIKRAEPDHALFEVPPDYGVTAK